MLWVRPIAPSRPRTSRQNDGHHHRGRGADRRVGSGNSPCAGTASLVASAVVGWYTLGDVAQRFDLDLLGDDDVFEVDAQAAHLFKHPHLGVDDIYDVWASDPLFYPAIPPAHWLMCAEVAGRVLVVPLAPARNGDPCRCRPIGSYEASTELAAQYRRDR